jgi:hypothetical protein
MFDTSRYTRSPTMNAASGISLAQALLASVPKDGSPLTQRRARVLRTALVTLQTAWASRAPRKTDARPADRATDTTWSALHGRLDAYASLDPEQVPRAKRAAELVELVYPDGLSFLQLPFNEQHAECDRRLRQIDDEGLDRDIDAIAGKEFLVEVRRTHVLYGEALGITKSEKAPAEETTIAEHLRTLSQAMNAYTLAVLTLIEDDDPSSVTMVRNALLPLDEYRAKRARNSTAPADDDETDPTIPTVVTPPKQ